MNKSIEKLVEPEKIKCAICGRTSNEVENGIFAVYEDLTDVLEGFVCYECLPKAEDLSPKILNKTIPKI